MKEKARELTTPATTRAQNQGYELVRRSTHQSYELLEHVKGIKPTDPKQQDLHETGQQDIQGDFFSNFVHILEPNLHRHCLPSPVIPKLGIFGIGRCCALLPRDACLQQRMMSA
ncbi:hypothetical protein STEG23_024271 [Scotinomys teguina]